MKDELGRTSLSRKHRHRADHQGTMERRTRRTSSPDAGSHSRHHWGSPIAYSYKAQALETTFSDNISTCTTTRVGNPRQSSISRFLVNACFFGHDCFTVFQLVQSTHACRHPVFAVSFKRESDQCRPEILNTIQWTYRQLPRARCTSSSKRYGEDHSPPYAGAATPSPRDRLANTALPTPDHLRLLTPRRQPVLPGSSSEPGQSR